MTLHLVELFNKKAQAHYAKHTGINVDIQNIGKNTDLIAVKEIKHSQEIKPGVWFEKNVVNFRDGNFANTYDLYWNPNQIGLLPAIHSSNRPYSLFNHTKRDPSIISTINGSFYFLTDIADSKPQDMPYDFCIRDNKIIGLPSSDEAIIYIQNDKLHTKEIVAQGMMEIGDNKIQWCGTKSKSRNENKAILYNSKCANIIRIREEKTNVQIGILDNTSIRTPKQEGVFDLVVVKNKAGVLRIKQINKGGGTHFFSGIFILQIKGDVKKFKKGDIVKPLLLDDLKLDSITSGMTIGKKVTDPYFLKSGIGENRDARSIVAEDINGHIHLTVFDGSKYIPGFRGVSAKEIAKFYSRKKYKWAYFLDGGGSTRLIIREHKKLKAYANYIAFRKLKNGMFLWDWRRARQIASSISLHMVKN